MKLAWLICLAIPAAAQTTGFSADSARGEALFDSLACVRCHAINARGGTGAPDLGRLADRSFTPASLAATMWNHAPAMWSAITAAKIPMPDVDEQAAADLFAYFYSARFFEKPGDAARGKRLFAERGCTGCHGLTSEIRPGAPPVAKWEDLNHPFALIEAMWNHMRPMLTATKEKRVAWPVLSGQDLSDLLVYLRNLPQTRNLGAGFQVASGARGSELFVSKGCSKCHSSATSLAGQIRGHTLTEIAAEMWDHGPRMAAAGAPPALFGAGEMRELLSYVWARQFFEDAGDPTRGQRVFVSKRCAGCHETGAAPRLTGGQRAYNGPAMIAALWHHGPAMLERMKLQGIPWPQLGAADMSGLIAYLNRKEKP